MKRLAQIAALSLILASTTATQAGYAGGYGGIYLGDVSSDTNYYGSVAIIVRTNNQASLVGSASGPTDAIGLYGQFKVQNDGTWSFQTNGITAHGQVFTNGTVTGELDFNGGGISTIDNCTIQPDSGPFQGRAGYYAGNWSGGGDSGKVVAIITALGQINYCVLSPSYQAFDGGGPDQLDQVTGSFSSFTVWTAEVDGVLTNGTYNLGGIFIANTSSGHFLMTRAGFVPRYLPPTITVPPQDRTVTYGANATFSVTATGTAPLTYQWYSNSIALAGATSRVLVVSNVQAAISGTIYSVDVQNLAGQTNVAAVLNAAPETVPPTLSIVSPVAGQRVNDAVVNVTGKASDNVRVDSVWYQLNGGAWAQANGTSNWNANVSGLVAGTNVVAAYAMDASGNLSPTRRVSFSFVVTSPLTLITNGIGGITHAFVGTSLEVGRTYSVTAVSGAGQAFSNWVGSVSSSSATLSFVMQSNMVLQANFISNPFLAARGVYNGLFAENVRAHERSGFFTLTLGERGGYSASLKRGTNSYPFSGTFSVAGQASKAVSVGGSPWTVTMALDLAGAQTLSGTVSAPQGVADLVAYRAVWNAATNPATYLNGKYTAVLPGNDNFTSNPGGDGYASVSVGLAGYATLAGSLGDGNAINQVVALSGNRQCAVYVPLYGGGGSLWGWLQFDATHPAATLNGALNWIKPPRPGAIYYPLGFTNHISATGSRYTPPANSTTRAINLTDGVVWFEGGNLATPFTNNVTLTTSNRVINGSANKLTLSITTSNGLFSGSVNVPGTARTNTFKGALLQDMDSGFGYFLGTNQSGRVFFGAP